MFFTLKHGLFLLFIVYVLAFDDIYVNGELSSEIIEKGRAQYQLLKERGSLPQYGSCWKSAVEHVDDGCKYLSEETQSDIALYLTNCFLAMSGHETYNCALDKKPNLRGICINSMSDRAFNVYTEFYTHTQNMCWFLRGQIWHETISENTFKVTKQLEISATNQEELLKSQQESLDLQEKILKHGQSLEQVLGQLYLSSKAHQEILAIMTESMGSFNSWIVGEMSWFESLIFYFSSVFLIVLITSSKRTAQSRLTVFLFLLINFLIERLIWFLTKSRMQPVTNNNYSLTYESIYGIIWYCRYSFMILNCLYLIYQAFYYKDLAVENYKYLTCINKQNCEILEIVEKIKNHLNLNFSKSDIHLINESIPEIKLSNDSSYSNGFVKEIHFESDNNNSVKGSNGIRSESPTFDLKNKAVLSKKSISNGSCEGRINGISARKPYCLLSERYNLRSKSRTPDLNV